jgi:hypothetical protein
MKDFGQHGRFAEMQPKDRTAIFSRAVQIIKDHNICTVAVTLEHATYKTILGKLKGMMGVYGLAFVGCVVATHKLARSQNYTRNIAFVMDTGNPYAAHVLAGHAAIQEKQTDEFFVNLGSLTFADDNKVTALQAADLVCWATRRRATGLPFLEGFDVLEGILDGQAHNQTSFTEAAMREIWGHIQDGISTPTEKP